MKFTDRRKNKNKKGSSTSERWGPKVATITVSRQTVETALHQANELASQWMEKNMDDKRLSQLSNSTEFLSMILNKTPQEMTQDGVSSIEEYFDDAIRPDCAMQAKKEVEMIAKWHRESNPAKPQPQQYRRQSPGMAQPAMASKKSSFITNRNEKGEPKTPEKLEVPRLAAKKPVAKPPVVAPAPTVDPAAPPTPPMGEKDLITYIPTDAVIKAIKDLSSEDDFAQNKDKQDGLVKLTEYLQTRPIEAVEGEAGGNPAAPAPAAPAPMPMAASAKRADEDDPKKAIIPLGGLVVAGTEDEDDTKTAGSEETAVRHDDVPVAPTPNVFQGGDDTKAEDTKTATEDNKELWQLPSNHPRNKDRKCCNHGQVGCPTCTQNQDEMVKRLNQKDKTGSWFVGDGELEVSESGGRTPEIDEAHSKQDDNTGIKRPATESIYKFAEWIPCSNPKCQNGVSDGWPCESCNGTGHMNSDTIDSRGGNNIRQIERDQFNKEITGSKHAAADPTIGKAVKQSQKLGEDLKNLYLSAKSLTSVNDSRPVREAVESIYRAANMFDEATKVFNKQQMQEEAEEEAERVKTQNKSKKSSSLFFGLNLAVAE